METDDGERFRRGQAILRRLNPHAIERLRESLQDIAPDLARHVTEFAYGDIYARPGLGLRDREIVTLAALAALGNAPRQLESHLGGALNAGVTREEIVEILLQIAVYAGFPAALNAMASARKVFGERDATAGAPGSDGGSAAEADDEAIR